MPYSTSERTPPISCAINAIMPAVLLLFGRSQVYSLARRRAVLRVISDEICDSLVHNAAQNGNSLPTFRDNQSVSSSRIKKSVSLSLKMGSIGCPQTSERNYHSTLCNIPQDGRPHLSSLVRAVSIVRPVKYRQNISN
jgi:hypothetical protein